MTSPVGERTRRRRARARLATFYELEADPKAMKASAMDIDEVTFKPDVYYAEKLKVCSVQELAELSRQLRSEIREQRQSLRELVHNNFSRFSESADVIQGMQGDVVKLTGTGKQLEEKLQKLEGLSSGVLSNLQPLCDEHSSLTGRRRLYRELRRLQSLPSWLEAAEDVELPDLVRYLEQALPIVVKYKENVPLFETTFEHVAGALGEIKHRLSNRAFSEGLTNGSSAEAVSLLIQIGEPALDVLDRWLTIRCGLFETRVAAIDENHPDAIRFLEDNCLDWILDFASATIAFDFQEVPTLARVFAETTTLPDFSTVLSTTVLSLVNVYLAKLAAILQQSKLPAEVIAHVSDSLGGVCAVGETALWLNLSSSIRKAFLTAADSIFVTLADNTLNNSVSSLQPALTELADQPREAATTFSTSCRNFLLSLHPISLVPLAPSHRQLWNSKLVEYAESFLSITLDVLATIMTPLQNVLLIGSIREAVVPELIGTLQQMIGRSSFSSNWNQRLADLRRHYLGRLVLEVGMELQHHLVNICNIAAELTEPLRTITPDCEALTASLAGWHAKLTETFVETTLPSRGDAIMTQPALELTPNVSAKTVSSFEFALKATEALSDAEAAIRRVAASSLYAPLAVGAEPLAEDADLLFQTIVLWLDLLFIHLISRTKMRPCGVELVSASVHYFRTSLGTFMRHGLPLHHALCNVMISRALLSLPPDVCLESSRVEIMSSLVE